MYFLYFYFPSTQLSIQFVAAHKNPQLADPQSQLQTAFSQIKT